MSLRAVIEKLLKKNSRITVIFEVFFTILFPKFWHVWLKTRGEDPDPDPHGSAFFWVPGSGSGSGSAQRRSVDPDPDPDPP